MFVFDAEKLKRALDAYVEGGAPALRALRVQDVDSVLVFFRSQAAEKLRVETRPAAPHQPARTVLGVEKERADG